MMSVRTVSAEVRTDDGWTLRVHRWYPPGPSRATPVLLLHGFGANGWLFHDPEGDSLGRHLATLGVQAWIPDLRGTHSSTPPCSARTARARAAALRRVTVADKLAHDLPAVVDLILAESGSHELDAVGHSLGGTLLYALLASPTRAPIRRLVAIAATVRYGLPLVARLLAAARARGAARAALPDPLPLRRLCQLGAATHVLLPAHEHFNVENVERGRLLRMMKHGVEDATLGEISELARWGAGDTGGPWGPSLLDALGRVEVPLLLLGGSVDRHVTANALAEVVTAWGGPVRRLRTFGRATGCHLDYGHTDLLLGERAPSEVFPTITGWLTSPSLEQRRRDGADGDWAVRPPSI